MLDKGIRNVNSGCDLWYQRKFEQTIKQIRYGMFGPPSKETLHGNNCSEFDQANHILSSLRVVTSDSTRPEGVPVVNG